MSAELQHSWDIPQKIAAISATRRSVRKVLADWGFENACDDIALVVTELVTNAIVHGSPDVRLVLCVRGGWLFGEVIDRGPDMPRHVAADSSAEHGRGLALVRSLAQSIGWSRNPDGGKSVWFSYRLS
jgi:anti-sigma regulatory factor (Ser/Thr protein kinase)